MKAAGTAVGILAHVDAGKTTLAESILYTAGVLRKRGRVDNGDTALDFDALERERGITIFSAEAPFSVSGRAFTLLDTPGHVDFSSEMERTLSVLDAAVLVISGTDGVQAHTRTVWQLLAHYAVPAMIFVTKMDYGRRTEEELLENIREELGPECVPFGPPDWEALATDSEEALSAYLQQGSVPDALVSDMVRGRRIFPVFFGSGLKGDGVPELLDALVRFLPEKEYPDEFGARIYKITHDASGARVLRVKVTGGTLRVRDRIGEERVSQIRVYTGDRSAPADFAGPGTVCAVWGLTEGQAGDGLGYEKSLGQSFLSPVMRYTMELPDGEDPMRVMGLLRGLSEEDPALHIAWDPYSREIRADLMGEVQAEILKSVLFTRFGLRTEFTKGRVLYKETVSAVSEGVGHYEPLRHYAEVHLLLEPLPRNSGLQFATRVRTDDLDRNWQNLILQHLYEKEHLGVLTGSPLTDTRITLVSGRAHLKHTEGGDFRQATYRAVRQGLMMNRPVLLEPWLRFRLEIPSERLGRAMDDLREKSAECLPPVYEGNGVILSGRGPASELLNYAKDVAAYTGGSGRLFLSDDGYDLCHNAEEVVGAFSYRPEADLENTPDSVFCTHGAGFQVPWNKVPDYMHLPSVFAEEKRAQAPPPKKQRHIDDETLEAIMLREFGPIRRPVYGKTDVPKKAEEEKGAGDGKEELLIVDGYNVIFAWEELRDLARSDIQAARERLIHILSNYSAFRRVETVLVFDGYRVPGNPGEETE